MAPTDNWRTIERRVAPGRKVSTMSNPYNVDGKPVARVVVDVVVTHAAVDDEMIERVGNVLTQGLGDTLDAFLGVNPVMADCGVERWWVRAEPAVGADVDQDVPTTGLEARYDDAYAVWEVARSRLVALLEAKIGAYAAEHYPQADELTVNGEDDVEGFFIRAQRVTVGGQLIDGYRSNGESSSDAWDDCVEDLDSTLLDFLAGLTGEDYRGTHTIAVPGAWD